MKYSCLLVPQTGMAHLKIDFLRGTYQLELFIHIGFAEKNPEGWGDLKTKFFKKPWDY